MTGEVMSVDGGSAARPSFLSPDDLSVFVHDDGIGSRVGRGSGWL
jgi:hypothetical protein